MLKTFVEEYVDLHLYLQRKHLNCFGAEVRDLWWRRLICRPGMLSPGTRAILVSQLILVLVFILLSSC